MVKDVNQLTERIKRIDKEAKVKLIYELMVDYDISSGDIVEYSVGKGNASVSTAERLKEINQARKAGVRYSENLAKARQARMEKRERMLAISKEVAPPAEKPKLTINPVSLEDIVHDSTKVD